MSLPIKPLGFPAELPAVPAAQQKNVPPTKNAANPQTQPVELIVNNHIHLAENTQTEAQTVLSFLDHEDVKKETLRYDQHQSQTQSTPQSHRVQNNKSSYQLSQTEQAQGDQKTRTLSTARSTEQESAEIKSFVNPQNGQTHSRKQKRVESHFQYDQQQQKNRLRFSRNSAQAHETVQNKDAQSTQLSTQKAAAFDVDYQRQTHMGRVHSEALELSLTNTQKSQKAKVSQTPLKNQLGLTNIDSRYHFNYKKKTGTQIPKAHALNFSAALNINSVGLEDSTYGTTQHDYSFEASTHYQHFAQGESNQSRFGLNTETRLQRSFAAPNASIKNGSLQLSTKNHIDLHHRAAQQHQQAYTFRADYTMERPQQEILYSFSAQTRFSSADISKDETELILSIENAEQSISLAYMNPFQNQERGEIRYSSSLPLSKTRLQMKADTEGNMGIRLERPHL